MRDITSFYDRFTHYSPENHAQLEQEIQLEGFTLVNEWLKKLENEIREADQIQLEQLITQIETAELLLAHPEKISPLWEGAWKDLRKMIEIKQRVYAQVPPREQDGEWQMTFNNPYSTEGIVVHGDLSFAHAAYMFAKYRNGLNKLEVVSLQKVQKFLVENGETHSQIED